MRLHYPPNYVLDEMEWYEIRAAMKYQHYAYKDLWEANRLPAYLTAQVNARKGSEIELTDIVCFPWEDKPNKEDDTSISKADIERLQNKAKEYLKHKNG